MFVFVVLCEKFTVHVSKRVPLVALRRKVQ